MLRYEKVKVSVSADSSVHEEVLRNVKVILTTLEGTVPYDRLFGMSVEILDAPMNEAKALYTVECVRKIRLYEPRAEVSSVDFDYGADGELYPKVVLHIEVE